MRLSCLLAVLSAVLSVGGANACCIFKCWKGSSAPAAGPAGAAAQTAATLEATPTFYVKVISVDGQAPGSTGTIPNPTAYATVVIQVEADYWDATYGLTLYLYQMGTPTTGTGPMAAARRPTGPPKTVVTAKAQPKAAAAPVAPTAGTAGIPVSFTLTGLSPNTTYSAYIFGNWASTSVTFTTKP